MNISQRDLGFLADRLRPWMDRWYGSGGISGASVEAHALDGSSHTGLLPWSKVSKANASLEDLPNGMLPWNRINRTSSQLADLEIRPHSHLTGIGPNDHHNAATGGAGISVDAAQVISLASSVAGNGLTFASGVIHAAVSGLGLSVGADAIALASSSNPGAAASILASNSSGYLQLVRLGLGKSPTVPLDVSGGAAISGALSAGSANISGSATVIGDLSVGTVLQVNTAGTRVGINRAADQQFDLDVAGAIRGQYLVGKHAIQLASAVGVWHYDGPAPYNLDYTGSDASHVGVGGTETGGVIYRPGKFGKAVQVAEATTNYCTDPSSEGASAWVAQYNGSGYLSGSQSSDYALYGNKSYKIVASQGTWTGYYNAPHYQVGGGVTWAPGDSITVSCYVCGTGTWRIVGEDTGQNLRGAQSVTATDQWQRVSVTCINDTGYTYSSFALAVFSETAGALYIDGVQIEKTPYVTPYCDGSLGPGHSWTGTPHASASTRTAATVTYSLNAKQSKQWTIMTWRKLDAFPDATSSWSIRWSCSTAGDRQMLLAYRNAENLWRWYTAVEDSGGTLRAAYVEYSSVGDWTGWHHLAMTIDVTTGAMVAYLDGVAIGSATLPSTNGWYNNAWNTLTLYHNGAASGLIDELVVLDYVADPKLIRAIYESDAPVFVESSVFHWRSPSRVPIWVDEFGLWARGVSGNEILGLYGGDPRNPAGGVTRSWGGVTLSENDIVIGRASGGYVFWDDSAQTLNLKGTMIVDGNSYLNGVVTIAAGGELRQGTGTIGSNYTGLRIWRDGDVGRIGGYNANTLQWYAGTDGKFYAGGGDIKIDADGIEFSADTGSQGALRWYSDFSGTPHHVGTINHVGLSIESWMNYYVYDTEAGYPPADSRHRFFINTTKILDVNRGGILVSGYVYADQISVVNDLGGIGGAIISLSNVSNTAANSTGVGTVRMKGATNRDSAGFIKIYIGTTAYYVPVFSAITG